MSLSRIWPGGSDRFFDHGPTFKGWVEALRYIMRDVTPDDRRKLLRDNAVLFYGLIKIAALKTIWIEPDGRVAVDLYEPTVRFTRSWAIFGEIGRGIRVSRIG